MLFPISVIFTPTDHKYYTHRLVAFKMTCGTLLVHYYLKVGDNDCTLVLQKHCLLVNGVEPFLSFKGCINQAARDSYIEESLHLLINDTLIKALSNFSMMENARNDVSTYYEHKSNKGIS